MHKHKYLSTKREQIDEMFVLDILNWFCVIQSFLLIRNGACLAKKLQISNLYSSGDRTFDIPHSNHTTDVVNFKCVNSDIFPGIISLFTLC